MTWLLVVTVCAVIAPGDARCTQEASRPVQHGKECFQMLNPTKDAVEAMAEATGMEIVYLHAVCKPGHVS